MLVPKSRDLSCLTNLLQTFPSLPRGSLLPFTLIYTFFFPLILCPRTHTPIREMESLGHMGHKHTGPRSRRLPDPPQPMPTVNDVVP